MTVIPVLYEDPDLVAVYKPPFFPVHPDSHHKKNTLIQQVLEKFPEIDGVGEDPIRPGLVHRLDKDTSGVLLIARNQIAFRYLKELFQRGEVEKTYNALVVGRVKNDKGIIDAPIARSAKNFERRVVGGKKGKERSAITEYRVKERIADKFTLLEAKPKTGRTHQIRSHLAHLGHPIVCDELYSGSRLVCPAGLRRQFLHASSLEFTSPSGARLRIAADLPEDLGDALEELRSNAKDGIKESYETERS